MNSKMNKSILKKEIVIYILIFSAALLLRLISVFNYSLPLEGDEISYNKLALSIVNEGRYYMESSYSRPPVYPFFIGMIYLIFGTKLIAVRIAQAALDSLLCMLIYRLCRMLFSRAIALTAAFTSAFYLLFIKGVSRFLTETLFTLILFWIIFYIYKTKERLTYPQASILGIGIAVLVLIKGITILFLPFLFLLLLWSGYYSPLGIKRALKRYAVVFMAFIAVISVWTYRNYRVYHAFVPVSTQGGYALYDCYFPKDGKIFGLNIMDDNVRYAVSLGSEVKMSRYLTGKTLEFIKNNPLKVLRLEVLKIFYFWAPFDWEMMGVGKGVYNYQYVFILPFAFLGMFLSARRLDRYAPLYIPGIYIFLMSLLFYGSPRFRMPVEPYFIVFFAVGIFKFFELFRNKYIPAMISALYLFLNFAFYLNSDIIKQILRNGAVSIGLW